MMQPVRELHPKIAQDILPDNVNGIDEPDDRADVHKDREQENEDLGIEAAERLERQAVLGLVGGQVDRPAG
jgi:hypothetical protein